MTTPASQTSSPNSEQFVTYTEMLGRARALHPHATISIDGVTGSWIITIPTELSEAYELEPNLRHTPAGIAHSSFDSGESVLERWARKNGYGSEPMHIVAERYNLCREEDRLHNEWLTAELHARGLRSRQEVLDGTAADATEDERALFALYFGEDSPAIAYAQKKLADRYAALRAAGY